jgi:hypothetical protein
MSNQETNSRFLNFFRAVPLLLLAAISLIVTLSQDSLYELSKFMAEADGYGSSWKSLYIVCGPLALMAIMATILNWKKKKGRWFSHAFYLLYPLIAGFSIWLWELLGIALMVIFLLAFLFNESDFLEDKGSLSVFGIIGLVVGGCYIIARLATSHAGWTDVALLCIYGVFLLYSIIAAITTTEGDTATLSMSGFRTVRKPALFLSIPFLISLFLLGMLFIAPNISYSFASSPSSKVAPPAANYFYCTGNDINVRESPNTQSRVLGKLQRNNQVNVLSGEQGFYKIEYNGGIGYVSVKFLQTTMSN